MTFACCVLRPGGDFDAEDVTRLRRGVHEHHPDISFIRLPLIYDWPGWWCKMELFRPRGLRYDMLYFDLDTIIVGDLTDIAKVTGLTTLTDFNVEERIASGMMLLPEACRAEVWDKWIADPAGHMAKFPGGDGDFLRSIWGQTPARWQNILPGQVVSYKNHVRGKGVPADARVVCFHGRPRPREIKWNLAEFEAVR